MDHEWRGSATSDPEYFPGVRGAAVGRDRLVLEEGAVRIRVGERDFPIPRDEVGKVYVCRRGLWEYGLCFEMKDVREYQFWGWWRRRGAEEAWHAVKKARYPVTRTIYKPGYGRLAKWGARP
ncbi:hypothetical protein E1287_33540 [Actinomadura sp. KC06]|uniref:hypothetical protein n=1 Tax=Actinomadura sp. KC06 TaxID=2530369 RepID=UPI00104E1AB9|nr:hypothetical protein [Actinomadura sp. KC06]TDD27965.1 hypothetical protein E1287_33540 [Actinomadura sp. KC06]